MTEVEKALAIVDEHLAPSNDRGMYTVTEMQDILLDVRLHLSKIKDATLDVAPPSFVTATSGSH